MLDQEEVQKKAKKWPLAIIAIFGMVLLGVITGYLLYKELHSIGSSYLESKENFEVNNNDSNTAESFIDWQSPEQIDNLYLFKVQNNYSKEDSASYYKVGTVIKGEYKGGDVILVSAICEGNCFYPEFFRIIKKENKIIFLKKYSSSLFDGLFKDDLFVDDDFDIPDLNFPDNLVGQKENQKLLKHPNINEFFDISGKVKVFVSDKYGVVYTDSLDYNNKISKHAFYLRAPDGTLQIYTLDNDLIKNEIPQIIWNSGVQNDNKYTATDYLICLSKELNFANVQPNNLKELLTPAGVTISGEIILGFKDSNIHYLTDFYDNTYYTAEGEKISYSSFISEHPIFFWVDPFGRLIQFTNKAFLPYEECSNTFI